MCLIAFNATPSKKLFEIPVPSRYVTYQTLPGGNNDVMYIKLVPPRESLVSDIPAGVGNSEKLFLRCTAKIECISRGLCLMESLVLITNLNEGRGAGLGGARGHPHTSKQ